MTNDVNHDVSHETARARVLVVDDDPDLLALMSMRLGAAGYEVLAAASGAEALELFHTRKPRVVITDLRMDEMDGHALFERLHESAPGVPVIMLTAHGTIPDAVAATQRGVFSFLTKPFDGRQLLALVAEALVLSPEIAAESEGSDWRANFVAASATTDELLRQARRVAETNEPLFLLGPPGSGKEHLGRLVHAASARAQEAFVPLRCSPDTDEALLADALREARGGSLFVDDVGASSPAIQARLLPYVREATPFATPTRSAGEPRIMAASSQPLDTLLNTGEFRVDLYYGLTRNVLELASLARRKDDIPLLVAHFTAVWAEQRQRPAPSFAPDALVLLQEAPWPGNVRQLRTVVDMSVSQAVAPVIPVSLVQRLLREQSENELVAFDDARRGFERDYLVQVLIATAGNVAHAARIARRNRTEFYKLLSRHDLDPAAFKQSAR
jgi:two-component system response regulator GlrR